MIVYNIDKSSQFYKGGGKSIALKNKQNKIVNLFYVDNYNTEDGFCSAVAKYVEFDFGQDMIFGMSSCYEFCDMINEPKNKDEEKLALEYAEEFIKYCVLIDKKIKNN